MAQYRAVFDAEVAFTNGGGLKAEGFRVDVASPDVGHTEVGRLWIASLGLLMAAEPRISNLRIIEEAHKGTRAGPSPAPAAPQMDAGPTPIDLEAWPRRQHFEHYLRTVPCTYSLTVELDATAFAEALGRTHRKTYIAQVWAIATAVNAHPEFRMGLTRDGRPAVWPVVHPAFTVFNPERETFAGVWTPYAPDFAAFHDRAAALLSEHTSATELFPQGALPPNTFDISSVPWTPFTGFNLNLHDAWSHLAPIFTLGRYNKHGNRRTLPLALQVHHAAADGFHTARLINELQTLLEDPTWLD